jgi:hypothetical protein
MVIGVVLLQGGTTVPPARFIDPNLIPRPWRLPVTLAAATWRPRNTPRYALGKSASNADSNARRAHGC